ncbi:MAG TPA: ATP-binding protein [Vicinamibacterales bacterium]|jgi:two-component system sensor histidine kinase PilS (NtrC family)
MEPSDRRRRLAWLIAIRAAISAVLLGSGVLIEINAPGVLPLTPFYLLIGLTFGFTALYAFALPYADHWLWMADAQLVGDAFVVSGFIAVTGGVTSYFSLLYVLPIIAASTVQGRRGAVTISVLSSLIYVGLVAAQYHGGFNAMSAWFPQPPELPPTRVAEYTVAINVFAFVAVASLSGSLAERLKRAGARLERASTEIANLQAFNQDVIDSLMSGLVSIDVAGRILSFNHAAEKITGQSYESVVGRAAADVLHLPDAVRSALTNDLDGERTRRAEFPYPMPTGGTIEIGLVVAHLLAPGGRMGYLLTFQDITDVRRLERDARVKQRLAAVGEMAAGIAHEIRNPLASMAGSIQVLREELSLNEDQAQLMDIVLRESKRLNETIRSFLAYARPQRAAVERLDLRKTVADTALLLRNSTEVLACHAIDVDVAADPVWFDADEGQIRQIVWNLATNGLRAMPSGGRLRLAVLAALPPSATSSSPADRYGAAVLEIEDEGVGIPPEELDGIFQPFHGTFGRGSGLGLAIVYRIVTDYNGEIDVTSTVGRGTRFRVVLGAPAAGLGG